MRPRDAPRAARRRPARRSREALLRRRLRPGALVRRRGLRRLGQDLDAGLAHAARVARRHARRTRSWRSLSRARRPARCASASMSGSPTFPAPRSTHEQRVRALRRAWRRCGARGGARTGARRRCRTACSPPAERSRSGPSMAGSRSCCARRRSRCSIGSAFRPTSSSSRIGASIDRPCIAPSTPHVLRRRGLARRSRGGHGSARPAPAARVARHRLGPAGRVRACR